ncbi:hypothetical protein RGQ13_18600 [Thalassotalea psychrophila]|uniref:Uncharacterized protein n=1 Tax=Thalassotalea psychrophila TaxID=3065647 RepID=A0ABY9TTF3_9GAMM|nr:hypothetical protein RGQ13_18600 [Colwelliaceae bacterium SQ149]
MENSNTEAEISFRFLSLDKFQAYTLQREILGSTYKEQLKNNCFVGYVPLTKQNLDDINDYYVRQRIEIDECDIFVSVNSASDTTIISIPVIVNRMLKYIDCKLTFSFSVV